MKNIRLIIILALLFVPLFLSPQNVPTAVEMESEAFILINNIRAENGLNKLVWDDDLYVSAVVRCKEGAVLFEHTRPAGQAYGSAFVNQCGYSGENMARGQTSPEQVVEDWMDSETHRALILDSKFKTAALACRFYNGSYYWIEHFSSNC